MTSDLNGSGVWFRARKACDCISTSSGTALGEFLCCIGIDSVFIPSASVVRGDVTEQRLKLVPSSAIDEVLVHARDVVPSAYGTYELELWCPTACAPKRVCQNEFEFTIPKDFKKSSRTKQMAKKPVIAVWGRRYQLESVRILNNRYQFRVTRLGAFWGGAEYEMLLCEIEQMLRFTPQYQLRRLWNRLTSSKIV